MDVHKLEVNFQVNHVNQPQLLRSSRPVPSVKPLPIGPAAKCTGSAKSSWVTYLHGRKCSRWISTSNTLAVRLDGLDWGIGHANSFQLLVWMLFEVGGNKLPVAFGQWIGTLSGHSCCGYVAVIPAPLLGLPDAACYAAPRIHENFYSTAPWNSDYRVFQHQPLIADGGFLCHRGTPIFIIHL